MPVSEIDPAALPEVDAAEHNRLMEEVSAFGGGGQGALTRLALSDQDRMARDWLAVWMKANGLRLEIDPVGNMFGILDWAGPDAPLVMTGSHIDSQPNGGRFDGSYGVIAACSAIAAVQRKAAAIGIAPKANFALATWTNEEGARFQPSVLGAGYHAGEHTLEFVLGRKDGDGISVGEALKSIGYAGTAKTPLPDAIIEMHIEGGSFLDRAGKRVAPFERYWGATKYRLAFIGKQAHTGPTPMAERQDALLAAALLIADIRDIADSIGPDMHTSVGRLEVSPNSPNVVPGEAVLFIELRSADPALLTDAEERMNACARKAADRASVDFEVRSIDRRPAGRFDPGLLQLAEETAASLGEASGMRLDTIAGHDSVALARATRTLVIAVRSSGTMHHPSEFAAPADRVFGANLLAGMLWRFCVEGEPRSSVAA